MTALDDALTLTPSGDGLTCVLGEDFSNAYVSRPATDGFPFGGLLAALAGKAMREGLGVAAPLRTLSVQYLASAAYGAPLTWRSRALRAGRTVTYAAVEAEQGGRLTHSASAVFGPDQPSETLAPLAAPPPPLADLDPARTISGPMQPRFAQHVDYVFEDGPNILGGNVGRAPVERLWMRMKDRRPLDETRLCYLLDALYPPSWTAFRRPSPMTTIALRYDLLAPAADALSADGWAFFEFRVLQYGEGWTVDEATAWDASGRPLALSRQRRKLLSNRPSRSAT